MTKKHRWLVRPLQALTIGALLLSPFLHSQAVGAGAQVTTQSSITEGKIQAMQSQIQMMQGQVQALTARIKAIEDQAQLASSPDDAKPSKILEQRLDALEREQAKQSAHEEKSGESSDHPEHLVVEAPFTVVDGEGKIIMRVGEKGDAGYSRGIYAFDEAGRPVAHMGANETGGRFYAMSPGSTIPELVLGVGKKGPGILMNDANGEKVTMGYESLAFHGEGDAVLSKFGTKNKVKGYLELNDSNGIMVEAGALDDHKGYVLANPYRASPELRGDPSVLKGGTRAN